MYVDNVAAMNIEIFRLRSAELIREAEAERLGREARDGRRAARRTAAAGGSTALGRRISRPAA